MSYCGLTPSEYSSGAKVRRGSITKAGSAAVRTALVESAQAYRDRPVIGAQLRRRQEGLSPETLARSWKAQQRLHATGASSAPAAGRTGSWPRPWPASSPGSPGPR